MERVGRFGAYYFGASDTPDWTLPHNDGLWQDGEKTLFDPCPAGWRVSCSGDQLNGNSPWMNFVTDLTSTTANATDTDYPMGPTGGYLFYRLDHGTVTCWFPAGGSRQATSAKLYRTSDSGYAWTSPLAGSAVCFLNYNSSGRILIYDSERRAFGFPVRCVRE